MKFWVTLVLMNILIQFQGLTNNSYVLYESDPMIIVEAVELDGIPQIEQDSPDLCLQPAVLIDFNNCSSFRAMNKPQNFIPKSYIEYIEMITSPPPKILLMKI